MRFFSRALRFCQPTPPSLSRSAVRALRAVAGQELDVLDRQEQAVVAGIEDLQAIVRRARRLDRLQPGEAADAVVDVDDEIAGGEARRLGQRVGGALALSRRADEAVAQHVLVADDRDVGRLEACLERQHRKPTVSAGGSAFSVAKSATGFRLREAVIDRAPGRAGRARLRSMTRAAPCARTSSAPRHGATSASKTLTSPAARSAAKERPVRPPMSIAGPPSSGSTNGVSRACGRLGQIGRAIRRR